jgi:plastocyanin
VRGASIAIAVLAQLVLPAAAFCATHVVQVEGMSFKPAVLTVKPGDTVVWQNKDIVPHTATAAGKFDSKQIAGGASWSWTARTKGRHDYVCSYHPGMKGSVVVAE